MDLVGEIVEHEPQVPTAPAIEQYAAKSGFPQLKRFDTVKPRNPRFKSAPKTDSERSKEARIPAQIPKNTDDSLKQLWLPFLNQMYQAKMSSSVKSNFGSQSFLRLSSQTKKNNSIVFLIGTVISAIWSQFCSAF